MKIPQETAFVKPFLRMILKIVHSAAFPAPGFGICAQNDRPRGGRAAGREEKNLRICAGRAHDRCRGGHAATDEMSWDMRCTTGGAEETMTFPPHPLRCAQHLLLKEKAWGAAHHRPCAIRRRCITSRAQSRRRLRVRSVRESLRFLVFAGKVWFNEGEKR